MIIYDNYTCMMLYPPKFCTNKPENQAFLKPYPWLPVFPTAPWQKATKVAIKSWLVAIELHWLRLKQHCWGWRYSPDPILHPSHNPPCRKFWGCQYREVWISLGWKLTWWYRFITWNITQLSTTSVHSKDPASHQYVIQLPDLMAWKCWLLRLTVVISTATLIVDSEIHPWNWNPHHKHKKYQQTMGFQTRIAPPQKKTA